MHISKLIETLELKRLNPSLELSWVFPQDIKGLDRELIIQAREADELSSEADLSDVVFNYIQECYRQGESCLSQDIQWGLTESFVRAMVYLIVEFQNSLAASNVPPSENVTSMDAKVCLQYFVEVLLNGNLNEYEVEMIQGYICDFYQYDDLWEPPEGRFFGELTKAENILIDFLGTRDLGIASLKKYGVPKEIMPMVLGTSLIERIKQ